MIVMHVDDQHTWRGGERQAGWLIEGLVQRGHDVIIAGKSGAPFVTSDFSNVEILNRIGAPFLGEFDVWTAWQLARSIARYNVDIIHAHTSHAHTLACIARGIAGKAKVVASRRVSFPPRNHILNRWKYGDPDRIIAVSGCVAEVLINAGVDENKVCVVHSAVDPQRLDVEPIRRSELEVPEDVPLLFNAGSLEKAKGHDVLLNAMAIILKEKPEAQLLIAGEGPLRTNIEARISELGLTASVKLLGHRKDVPRITRAADVYVASSNSEGLGTSVLEALVCGIPVVSTTAGGANEMIKHEDTGLLVPIGDPEELAKAVIRMLSNEEMAQNITREAEIFVRKNFSVENMVEKTIDVYESLL